MLKFSRWSTSVVAGVLLLMSATLALALPTPKDIEAAVAAGHYTQAETMLREVLKEKPQSAKAHYELGQVLADQRRYKEAQSELQLAKDIDPALKFASQPEKFNAVFAKVADLAATPTSSVVMAPSVSSAVTTATHNAAPESVASGGAFSMSYVWIGIAGLVVLGLWLRRSAAAKANAASPYVRPYASPASLTGAAAPRGFGAQFSPAAPQAAYGPQGFAQANTGGSTMTGAVVGGVAGLAAGYALSKALEGGHQTSAPANTEGASTHQGGYVPFDTPSPQPDTGAFDAGSGNDWDSADSGDSGDDSW